MRALALAAVLLATASPARPSGTSDPSCPVVERIAPGGLVFRFSAWSTFATAWVRAFHAAHPGASLPVLAADPAVLRRQICLPGTPDGLFTDDPRELSSMHAEGSCPGNGPWIVQFDSTGGLSLIARDPHGGYVVFVDALSRPIGTSRFRISSTPNRITIRQTSRVAVSVPCDPTALECTERTERKIGEQTVERFSLRPAGMLGGVRVSDEQRLTPWEPSKLAVGADQVAVTTRGCPSRVVPLPR